MTKLVEKNEKNEEKEENEEEKKEEKKETENEEEKENEEKEERNAVNFSCALKPYIQVPNHAEPFKVITMWKPEWNLWAQLTLMSKPSANMRLDAYIQDSIETHQSSYDNNVPIIEVLPHKATWEGTLVVKHPGITTKLQVLTTTGGRKDFDEIYENRPSIVSGGALEQITISDGEMTVLRVLPKQLPRRLPKQSPISIYMTLLLLIILIFTILLILTYYLVV